MYDCVKVKYLPVTETKGARIKIYFDEGAKEYPRQYAFSTDDQIAMIIEEKIGVKVLHKHWEKEVCYAFCKK